VGVGPVGDPAARLNEKLDHLQAQHPFLYNLVTGALVGAVLVLLRFHWLLAAGYAISWAVVRAYLWRDGNILHRQYEVRLARVAHRKAARRRER